MTSIADLIASRRDLSIKVGKGRLNVAYDPNMVTMAESARLQRLAEDGDPLVLGTRLERMLLEWDADGPVKAEVDVEDGEDENGDPLYRREFQTIVEDGKRIPLKAEVLQYLPNEVLLSIITKIHEDAAPNPTSRRPTQIGSRRRG